MTDDTPPYEDEFLENGIRLKYEWCLEPYGEAQYSCYELGRPNPCARCAEKEAGEHD